MKASETFNKILIAPCGINCGTCLAFLREKNRCFGCRVGSEKKSVARERCIIKNCDSLAKTKSDYCYECETFPCKRMKQLDRRYRNRYSTSLIQNLLDLQKTGMNKHLKNEIIKWTCEKCGSILSIHREKCLFCVPEDLQISKRSSIDLTELLPDTGKLSANHAAGVAMKKKGLIQQLLHAAFTEKHPMSTRAANTIEIIDSQKPELIKPYYKKIISAFPSFTADGQKRCLLKIFTRHVAGLKDDELCALLNYCFDAVNSSFESVGVKAYSVMILFEISKREPDIKNELAAAISSQLTESSEAFKNIGNKILLKLRK